jgi:hypothetical protein
MDTCIETNENIAFGMEVYSRYMPGICKGLEYVRHMSFVCLTFDTIWIPDVNQELISLNKGLCSPNFAQRRGIVS